MEEKEWFLYVVDHHEGPFTLDEVKKRVSDGQAKSSSYVWKEGLADWMMMTDVPDFGSAAPSGDGHGKPAFVVDIGKVSPSASVWCLNSRKLFSGPHSMKTIVRKLNDGETTPQDSIWREGWTSFVTLSNLPEIMNQVKPDVLSGEKKGKKREYSASAAALGMDGGSSARTYVWYKSTKFTAVVMLLLLAGLYQSLAVGTFESFVKTKSLHLQPIPFDLLGEIPRMATPTYNKIAAMLPEPVRGYLLPVQIPDNLLPNDVETLRDAALSDLKQGARVATALPPGDEFNPQFVIASNAPDGTTLVAILRGKEGTLLNAGSYEKTLTIDLMKHIARTPRIIYQDGKALPKGEYTLVVYEADRQSAEVTAQVAALPRRTTPSMVPKGKVAFVVDSYFLGGKKDAAYTARLKEYNDRSKQRDAQQLTELRQLALTIESMANESAAKFFSLSKGVARSRKPVWQQYDAKYGKMSGQIKADIEKATKVGDPANNTFMELYRKLAQTYDLSEQLHNSESAVVAGTGKMDVVKQQASQAAGAINELKQSILKVIK